MNLDSLLSFFLLEISMAKEAFLTLNEIGILLISSKQNAMQLETAGGKVLE